MRLKKPREQEIQETAESFAQALGIGVETLKTTQVSLFDLIPITHDTEGQKAFSSCRSVWRVACFYMVKALLRQLGKLPPEKGET